MKIWHLEPTKYGRRRNGPFDAWDTCQGLVVRAMTEREARLLAPPNAGDENRVNGKDAWADPKLTQCVEIGLCNIEGDDPGPGVILVDFKNG